MIVLYSGGKDSNYALVKALDHGYKIRKLISIKPDNAFSSMYHYPAIEITKTQAELLDLPLDLYFVKEEEKFSKLKEILEMEKPKAIITGAIASAYQAGNINKIAYELNIYVHSPSWLTPYKLYLNQLKERCFEIIISRVSSYGLKKEWVGKNLFEVIEKAQYINLVGEGGEYESLVLYQPYFKGKIVIDRYKIKVIDEYTADIVIEDYHIEQYKKHCPKKDLKLEGNKTLIIDMTDNILSFYEYVMPIYYQTKGTIINYKQINKIDLDEFDKIIVSSFPPIEKKYFNIDFNKPTIVIGNSVQFLDVDLVEKPTFGLNQIKLNNKITNAYFLAKYLVKNANGFAKLNNYDVGFRIKDITAYIFNPEYNAFVYGEKLF